MSPSKQRERRRSAAQRQPAAYRRLHSTALVRRRRLIQALVGLAFLGVAILGVAGVFTSTQQSKQPFGASQSQGSKQPGGPPLPVRDMPVDAAHAIHPVFRTPPHAALVFDFASQKALWRSDDFTPMPIASLTKIMTALLVVEHTHPDDQVQIPPEALNTPGQAVGLQTTGGQTVPVETLLKALLIESGNDAATALAVHVGGSVPQFVAMMNQRAHDWGLQCTTYVSPHGLEPGNRSCAADLAVLSELAMRQPRITQITPQATADIPYPNRLGHLKLATTNPLLKLHYPGTVGLKTGTTDEAGSTYVGVAEREGHTLGVVLLDSPNRGEQARELLDDGFRAEAGPSPASATARGRR